MDAPKFQIAPLTEAIRCGVADRFSPLRKSLAGAEWRILWWCEAGILLP